MQKGTLNYKKQEALKKAVWKSKLSFIAWLNCSSVKVSTWIKVMQAAFKEKCPLSKPSMHKLRLKMTVGSCNSNTDEWTLALRIQIGPSWQLKGGKASKLCTLVSQRTMFWEPTQCIKYNLSMREEHYLSFNSALPYLLFLITVHFLLLTSREQIAS